MERVRITEMRRIRERQTGQRLKNKDAVRVIFKDDGINDNTAQARMSKWDNGKNLESLKPRHILRMAKLYATTNIEEMFEA
jgi:hypothetical protein